jgi:SagB-type dehydrogenase family enzyme
MYHYDGLHHQLRLVSAPSELTDKLKNMAFFTAGAEGKPQVILVLSARFKRVNMKYQSVAYALIMKHVGVVYQTMYLVATHLGLAPCALGGGDSALFSKITGLPPWEEGSVGEFMLGSLPEKPVP